MSGPTVFVPTLNITVPVANISTPLIFLTPGQAQDLNLAVYLHIGATGVMIWDFLDNLRNDFTMPITPKTRIPTIMYFVVRLTLVAYCLGRAALLTLPIENCAKLAHVLNGLLAINGILETGLCYLRVIMVYNRHPFVVTFYSCVWISAVAMTLTIFKTFSASHIPNTHYCVESIGGPLAIPTLAIWVANDTMIYIGIAYRIYNIFQTYDFGPSTKRRVAIMVFGASLPTLGSKIVLLESQLYCLIILLSKGTLLVLVSIDKQHYIMFLICHLVLVSILISRVFRELMNTRDDNARKPNTEFQTGNLTTAEFSPNFSISCVQQVMPKRSFDSQASVSVNAGPSEHTDVLKHDSPSNLDLRLPEEIHLPHHYQKDDV